MALVRRAMYLIGRENRGRVMLLVPLAVVMSGFEVLGAALVYALVSLATGATPELELPLLGRISDYVAVEGAALTVGIAVGMGLFFVALMGAKIGHTYVQTRLVQNMGARLSAKLNAGYLAMPYPFHLRRNSSDLIRNANQVVRDVFSQAITPMVKVIAEVVLTVGMLALLVSVSPLATGMAIVVLGATSLVLLKVVRPWLKRLGARAHTLNAETLKTLQQSYHGIRDVKILSGERAFARRYARDQRALARTAYLRSTIKQLPKSLVELALIGFILAFFTVMVLIGRDTPETLAILGLFAYVGQRLQKSTEGILSGINQLQYAQAPIDQLHDDLEEIRLHSESLDDIDPLPFEREISVNDVVFRYETSSDFALDHVSLRIVKGEVVGICGPTGGGKTTLVDVISGLLCPTEGSVTIDGVDLRSNERAWQLHLGVVPQMVYLIDGSLRDNVALAEPADQIDEQAVEEAIKLAQLRDFVDRLPNGLDTIVGERGARVSGGQRQRVAIARALYRRPSVLIFDEGTSALDNVTEREVMNALERLRGEHTILLIAHRLSTVRNADKVVLMRDGRVEATGTYEALMESSPEFADLAAT